jgi:hypothetical protein
VSCQTPLALGILVCGILGRANLLQVHTFPAAAVPYSAFVPCFLDQDAAHGLSRGGEKVPPAVPLRFTGGIPFATSRESEVRLVNEGRGIQGLPRAFLRHLLGCQPPELVINKRQQPPGKPVMTSAHEWDRPLSPAHPLSSELGNLFRGCGYPIS